MKSTALTQKHRQLGAKMVEYAGYEMPVYYSGIKDEHLNVRNHVGLFDVSHMGEFIVSGKKSGELVQYVTSNDISKLFPGRAQYSCLPNDKMGIVDDLLVYKQDDHQFLLVVNAANIEKDWNWIQEKNKKFGAELKNISDEMSLLALQGPKATKTLKKLTYIDIEDIKFYHFTYGKVAGIENVLISATGYTGSGGFELYVANKDAEQLWDAIMEAGKEYQIKPVGLGARDTLRMEMGFCLYGNDINDHTSPLEAGLGWITKFNHDFPCREQLENQKQEGIKQKLVGFELKEKGIPRKDYEIVNGDEKTIGIVTSGTQSPSLDKAIGLGYINVEYALIGTNIGIKIRNKTVKAEVIKLPFYKTLE